MIRLASLASWAARKTCIKGVLRRECRFGLSIHPQSQGATLPDWNMPETVGTGFSERQCLKSRDEWMKGSTRRLCQHGYGGYAVLFVCRFHANLTPPSALPSLDCGVWVTSVSTNCSEIDFIGRIAPPLPAI